MTDLNQLVEDAVQEEIINGGFDGDYEVNQIDDKPGFHGCIDTASFSHIKIGYNPEYEKRKPGRLVETVRDIAKHEIDHREYRGFHGCPKNEEKHTEKIFEPMTEVLQPKGYGFDDWHYMANCLEDTILHDDLNDEFALNGIKNFFEEIGRYCSKAKNEEGREKRRYTDFYEAHVKLNMYLWGKKSHKKELKKYFKHSEQVKEVIQNFLERTGINKLKKTIIVDYGKRPGVNRLNKKVILDGKEAEVKDKARIRAYLNNEENWPEIARIYAEEFSKLMQPGYALPIFNHSGKNTKGKGKPGKKPTQGNPFDKKMYDPLFKQKRIKKAHYNGEKLPLWIDSYEALDLLYESFGQRMNIKVESYTEHGNLPVFWYHKREFDPEKDDYKHLTFGFNDKGEIVLQKKRLHIDMPLEHKVDPKGFPEVRFGLFDTSDTMRSDPFGGRNIGRTNIIPWGDNSRYHHLLVAWYGFLEYLKQNHRLSQSGMVLGNFSSETKVAKGLREAKRLALDPQFGTTLIDMERIREIFENREMLVFTVSDGAIYNWDSIKDEFIKLAKKHYYFHLQIGAEKDEEENIIVPQFCKDLEENNLMTVYLEDSADLATTVIDLTDNIYRGNIKFKQKENDIEVVAAE